ncbi:MAG: CPBP family intramembrane glutamic endopeptidase [Pirellulales bacterium]
MLALFIVIELAAALLGLALAWLFGVPLLERIEWDARSLGIGVVATLPLLVALAVGLRWPPRPLRNLFDRLETEVLPLFAHASWTQLIVLSLAAGFGEEILFRGFLQQAFSDRFGTTVGLVTASLLFGLAHPMSKTYVLLAAAIGAWLGVLYVQTAGLAAPITTHALYDFVALVWLVRRHKRDMAQAAPTNPPTDSFDRPDDQPEH